MYYNPKHITSIIHYIIGNTQLYVYTDISITKYVTPNKYVMFKNVLYIMFTYWHHRT